MIGLSVELTGRQADVGINVRDAALMAVDEINDRGGVDGRPLELVVRDDQGSADVARQVDAELIDEGVVAIIGHYTSGQVAAVLDQVNEAQVVLISPSASSSAFSGTADYFFRLIPDTYFIGTRLGEHIASDHSLQFLVSVYDENNLAFSRSFYDAVKEGYEASGGQVEGIPFNSTSTDLKQLATQIAESDPDGVIFIASAVDTAVLAQYLRQEGTQAQFFSSPWAQTSQLIEKGGQAIEGTEVSGFYNSENRLESHLEFAQAFRERFGREPQLGTSQAYECVMVLAEALKATGGGRDGLPEALLALRDLPGILGPITFDPYGDVHRDVYIMRVEAGKLVEKMVIPAP